MSFEAKSCFNFRSYSSSCMDLKPLMELSSFMTLQICQDLVNTNMADV